MAEGAIHGVELHALFKVLIGGGQRVVDARRMAFHGGIDGSHGQAMFKVRGFDIGGGGEKSEHGEAEAAQYQHEDSNDDTKSELSHEASATDYCVRWAGRGASRARAIRAGKKTQGPSTTLRMTEGTGFHSNRQRADECVRGQ